ncbi:MAG: hypothetical protein ACK5HA_15535, partial [Planctomycetaceae bacterium]
ASKLIDSVNRSTRGSVACEKRPPQAFDTNRTSKNGESAGTVNELERWMEAGCSAAHRQEWQPAALSGDG